MAKEVILLENVPGLGDQGEVARVSDGYARNYLLPRKLAAPVTDSTRRMIEKKRKAAEALKAAEREKWQQVVQLIVTTPLTIPVKVGDGDRMYGSINVIDLIERAKHVGITLDKKQIQLPEPLREIGSHTVAIKLAEDISADLKVNLVRE